MRVANEKVTHPDESMRILRFEVPRFAAPRHRHGHLELTWIERGHGLRYVGDDARPFAAGDLVLVGADLAHCWISTRGAGPCVATVVQFPATLMGGLCFPEARALAPLAALAGRGIAVHGATAASVIASLVAMRDAGPLARLGLLLQALEALAERRADRVALARRASHAHGADGRPAPADRVVDWIRKNYGRRLGVVEAARIAHVSPRAFSRFFTREVGRSFVTYVNDVRCAEAQLRLRERSARVERVARECGFPTMSNFNRHFRRRTGVSARDFRRAWDSEEREAQIGDLVPSGPFDTTRSRP